MCKPSELYILVIDNEKNSLNEVCATLREYDLTRIECASSSVSTLDMVAHYAQLSERVFDLIFCNSGLKGAYLLMATIHNKYPGLISIMYSDCGSPVAHLEALRNGGVEFIPKDEKFKERFALKIPKWIEISTLRADLLDGASYAR